MPTEPRNHTHETPAAPLNDDRSRRAGALPPSLRSLLGAILDHTATMGSVPDPHATARDLGLGADAALSELAAADLIALGPDGGIRAAYPFSPTPTRHHVRLDTGVETYAMCAIDALGIPAMLHTGATITSTTPDSGATVIIAATPGQATWSPESAVVLAPARESGCSTVSVDSCCDVVDMFTTAREAHAWADAHPHLNAAVLDQPTALRAAETIFGRLLDITGQR